jgi:hypothetical protein
LFARLGAQYGALAAYDAGFGRTLSGSSVTAWANLLNPALYPWAQGGATTLCPTYGVDAKGDYLAFDGGDFMICNALAAAFTGSNKPFWLVAAIDAVTRDATVACLLSIADATLSSFSFVGAFPNQTSTTGSGQRTGATSATVTTSATEGVLTDWYDGTNRRMRIGAAASSLQAQSANLTLSLATLGALRYGATPALAYYAKLKLRGLLIGTTIIEADLAVMAAAVKAVKGY